MFFIGIIEHLEVEKVNIREYTKLPFFLHRLRGPSRGSCVRRPGSEDPPSSLAEMNLFFSCRHEIVRIGYADNIS